MTLQRSGSGGKLRHPGHLLLVDIYFGYKWHLLTCILSFGLMEEMYLAKYRKHPGSKMCQSWSLKKHCSCFRNVSENAQEEVAVRQPLNSTVLQRNVQTGICYLKCLLKKNTHI